MFLVYIYGLNLLIVFLFILFIDFHFNSILRLCFVLHTLKIVFMLLALSLCSYIYVYCLIHLLLFIFYAIGVGICSIKQTRY